jgi:hypothetical protein
MVDEYIRSVFLFNESITLMVTEPLHSSIAHGNILLSYNFNVANWRISMVRTDGSFRERLSGKRKAGLG